VEPRAGQDAGHAGAIIPPLASLELYNHTFDYVAFTPIVLKMGHRAT
jgi:hypothetical protein